jgi:tetratricopeptide (TPR) repeat protein
LSYDEVVHSTVRALSEFGRFSEADAVINKLLSIVEGKSALYIMTCSAASYSHWTASKFDRAVEFSFLGVEAKKESGLDTRFDCSHDLALALRDSGKTKEALLLFLNGEKMADVVSLGLKKYGNNGPFYGNIGRCLLLDGNLEDAEICIKKSAHILESQNNIASGNNRGYAAFWLGEINAKLGKSHLAVLCYENACYKWQKTHLVMFKRALTELGKIMPGAARRIEESIERPEAVRKYLDYVGV